MGRGKGGGGGGATPRVKLAIRIHMGSRLGRIIRWLGCSIGFPGVKFGLRIHKGSSHGAHNPRVCELSMIPRVKIMIPDA